MLMRKRNRIIDSTNREILRLMYNARRELTGNQIARRINLSAPAIRPRLNNLRNMGIVRPVRTGKERTFRRTFGDSNTFVRIRAPSKIHWGLDIQTKKTNKSKRRSV